MPRVEWKVRHGEGRILHCVGDMHGVWGGIPARIHYTHGAAVADAADVGVAGEDVTCPKHTYIWGLELLLHLIQ